MQIKFDGSPKRYLPSLVYIARIGFEVVGFPLQIRCPATATFRSQQIVYPRDELIGCHELKKARAAILLRLVRSIPRHRR
jgi:hypothetical protein